MLRMFMISLLAAVSCFAQMKVTGVLRPRNYSPVPLASPVANNGIQYNGGPVLNNPHGTNVYLIWYGNWVNSPTPAIVTDFVKNIGGTAYYNINSSYYDFNPAGEKDPVVNRVNYGGSIYDNYSRGASLTDDDVGLIIQNAVFSGKLPNDPTAGVYEVITSADVIETSGFCGPPTNYYCAFHGWQTTPNGENLLGGFVGDPNQCPALCSSQSQTPNNNFAADTMVSSIAHELSETVTDPFDTSWINPDGSENGDLCVFTYGKVHLLPNGSYYNVKFGGRLWLTQQIWVNARGGYCALALDE